MKTTAKVRCTCKRGQARDNCPQCEGTGYKIDFAAIRAASRAKDAERIAPAMEQGTAQLASIKGMVEALQKAGNTHVTDVDAAMSGLDAYEEAERIIHEDALSVEVRSDWYSPGMLPDHTKPAEYRILLCTGGPSCQIVGKISEHGEPETAEMQVQDWFTPWTRMPTNGADEDAMLTYARCFYFGE